MSRSSKTLWAFIVGAAAGAVVGILYAPDKGENTRNKLYFQLNKYRDQLKQLINDIVDGKEIPDSMAKSEGKKVVNDTKVKAEKLLEDVEKMMSQIKSVEIKVNDLVLTSNGYKKVLKVFNNGLQQVINYSIQNDIFNVTLVSTKEHKIKTTKGWKQISKLKSGQMVYLHKDLIIKNINYIQKKNILESEIKDCMLQFGNFIMGIFQKVIMYIIRISILGIIIFKILKLLKSINIYRNMVSKGLKTILNGLNLFMKKVLNPLKNGISQMMVKSGIQNMVKKFMLKEYLINMYAKYVKKNIKQGIQEEQSIVIKTAKLKHLELGESYQANVYDLMIEDEHEYFANGILVHNCIDALRYLAMNKLSSLSDWMDFE